VDLIDYDVISLTSDGETVPTRRWKQLHVPASPAAGSLVVPSSVCNNPRVVILSVDGDVWETEDNGIRTMEFCVDEADRNVTDLAMNVLAGRVHFDRQEDGEAILRNRGYELRLRPSAPATEEL